MPPSVNLDPSAYASQRGELRPSAVAVRLLNRLSGTRNPEVAGGVAPAGTSAAEEPRPNVARADPSASSGDLLETLPDLEFARKQQESQKAKQIELPVIDSRLEVQLSSQSRRQRVPYEGEAEVRPRLDIRV